MTYGPLLLTAILNLADLRQAVNDNFVDGMPFTITGTVVRAERNVGTQGLVSTGYLLSDSTGNYGTISTNGLPPVPPASLVEASGLLGIERNGWPRSYVDSIRVLGQGKLPPVVRIVTTQLSDERFDARLVTMRGLVCDIQPDEVDHQFMVITLRSPEGPFLCTLTRKELSGLPRLRTGAEVELLGVVHNRAQGGKRQFQHATLSLSPNGVRILTPAPDDPFFESPDIKNVVHMAPAAVANLGLRKATGRVLVLLNDTSLILKTDGGRIVKTYLRGQEQPAPGTRIEVVGFPETDLFSLILTGADYRPQAVEAEDAEAPLDLSAAQLIFRDNTGLRYQSEYYGRLVRLCGTIECLQRPEGRRLTLVSDRESFDLDLTSCPALAEKLAAGTEVELTGICVFQTETWTFRLINPRIHGVTLAPRSADDVKTIKAAPWWTMGKLLIVIFALFTALVVILIWNRWLRRLVERRGRQLFKAEIAQAKADLRVEDRTRLAADLHDSIAQTLTGVGFQIDAAAKTLSDEDRTACANFLVIAKRTLLSCREELRRCLWDLRAHAIENPDLAAAIQETIRPVIGTAQISVRFNVPREHLSDSTTHALLCIIRELVSNAIRHGKASRIRIAGEQQDEHLRFSVSDDGTGFDPSDRPGPSLGHFGLQGIRERLTKLNGEMTVTSSRGKGTRIIVEIGK